MLLYSRRVILVSVLGLLLVVGLSSAQECPDGQSWCQDRCGTNLDTCCETPDRQHNLCGPGLSQSYQQVSKVEETDVELVFRDHLLRLWMLP